jgi:hypothetical protein
LASDIDFDWLRHAIACLNMHRRLRLSTTLTDDSLSFLLNRLPHSPPRSHHHHQMEALLVNHPHDPSYFFLFFLKRHEPLSLLLTKITEQN